MQRHEGDVWSKERDDVKPRVPMEEDRRQKTEWMVVFGDSDANSL